MERVTARYPAKILGILVTLLVGPGCATITGGGRDQKVKITSNPAGAAVVVDGQPQGETPATVDLSRKTEHQVALSYPGCEPAQMTIHRGLNPWLFGNLVLGGPVGLIVDVCTGATHQLSPDEITVQLHSQSDRKGYAPAAN
jgi:hypothetical protein